MKFPGGCRDRVLDQAKSPALLELRAKEQLFPGKIVFVEPTERIEEFFAAKHETASRPSTDNLPTQNNAKIHQSLDPKDGLFIVNRDS